ncbi:McrB family protein [Acinetobacter defluvii]|uniref:McrB family protein n=1 Tax=Acinetobacter defluvii TaxID=1871111 RepID=UPI003AF85FDD
MNKVLIEQWFVELIDKEHLKGWYSGYQNTIYKVVDYRKKLVEGYKLTAENDEEFLALLLKNDENGVASKGQSVLSNNVYAQLIKNEGFLKSVEQLILDPNLENYTYFRQFGDDLLNQLGSTKRPLLFNRACASCTLKVSAVVDEIKFDRLLKYLDKNNIMQIPEDIKKKNWYERNIFVVSQLREALSDLIESNQANEYWVNIFLWEIYAVKVAGFNAEKVIEILDKRYPETYTGTVHIAAFRTQNGRELALDPKSQTAIIICDSKPPENLNLSIKQYYKIDDSRHHHLSTHAKTLDVGHEAYSIIINNINELEAFCQWYEVNETLFDLNMVKKEDKDMNSLVSLQPLNQILFGPAGTGKTYHTVNHALQIIDPNFYEAHKAPEKRDTLKQEFQKYVDNGQIQFVTFHQSFSYEDFIEGIRVKSVNNQLNYSVEPGIFKYICDQAENFNKRNLFDQQVATDESIIQAISSLVERAKEQEIIFHTKRNLVFKVRSNTRGTLIATTSNDTDIVLANKYIRDYLKVQSEEIIAQKSYEWAIAKSLRSEVEYQSIDSNPQSLPYVLIIDEINRGNISRIFGELITLIEESKRKGNAEELSTVLPYSKESFSVPNNLYIIGTMNSSDRSLTGLDLALRRRFTFTEMAPNPSLLFGVNVEGVEIDRLLDILNQRIEILLDRDHCIGHAYFMPLKDKPELSVLKDIFLQKIIPLLQEYFFDDWEHIHAVLNENEMLKKKYNASKMNGLFKTSKSMSRDIWEVNTQAFDDLNAYQTIYAGTDLEAE